MKRKPPTLLIDGDHLVHKAAEATADSYALPSEEDDGIEVTKVYHLDQAKAYILGKLHEYMDVLKTNTYIVCLSCVGPTFRHDLTDTYKAHRPPKADEIRELADWVKEALPHKMKLRLEADDVMGITATLVSNCIIVADDKDMLTVPCRLYIPRTGEKLTISKEEADLNHLIQTISGDSTDNYKGAPNVGPVKARKYLDEVDPADHWFAVVETFRCKGLDEEHALLQARLARILRATDYDFKKDEVKLWTPTS